MDWLLLFVWVLLSILITLVVLLAVPLEWRFNVELDEDHRGADSHIRWLFGLVIIRTSNEPRSDSSEKPAKPKKRKPKRNRQSLRRVLSVDGFVGRLLTLIRRIVSAIHIEQLSVQARLGLGDPADTGQLWGVIGPVTGLLSIPKATRINIEPDFFNEVLEFQSDGRLRVIPLRLIGLFLGFLLSFNTWRAFRAIKAGARE